ncbi:LTA synthase family protein [Apilactobacillus apinorum]|uniref:LTA synthase family protein n=1 Tax=Apilactobacillus apinorum TaxID=1218495 RepID=UPI0006B508A0|nr:LTA synthase family protein [Apilactobacillus apinorum]KOY69684.1 Phosphatidylglycerol--membrane-oligosaccharide glycerophosphotransferase [Apilactobacillus apinorum]CAI2620432.1 Fhon1301820Phosphatidylglycerol--membrane-oligosaccharideglycerophosphotransferase [Apilactobacillus apinorum]
MKAINYIRTKLSTRFGFFCLLVGLFWAKTIYAYFTDFQLGLANPFEYFVALFNPIATTLFLLGLAMYIKSSRLFYPIILLIDGLNTLLLYLNVIYYREFTDFMTVSTMTGYSKVNQGLSGSSLALTMPHDVFYWLDIVLILVLLLFRVIRIDKGKIGFKGAFAITSTAILIFTANLSFGEMARPQLLTRTFDRTYIVKYLGLNAFTVYDGIKQQHNNDLRAMATKSEMNDVHKFINKHYAAPNAKLFGSQKGKNVIVIHLESFQQFLIDKKVNGQEVTPFLNSLYHSKSTYAFSNFFHEVGQGKTSDAENMLETSTYGLPQGSLFTQFGSDNVFQAAPSILKQEKGYTSAVFHGNVASFWNRNNVYKNMGYQYFFDASYYDTSGDRASGYGLKDKLLFKDSVKYLQRLQQPFYIKYITVTNHFPYTIDSEDSNFKTTNTGDSSVDNYFKTAHYLDEAVKEFYAYLQKAGLLKNSIIMLYGDHYGISNSENINLAKALDKNPNDWNNFDNAQLQRVPLMFNIPGMKSGYIDNTYGGEIDVLPTLLHLLGVNTKKYIQFGTDLFSKKHDTVVAFRNRDWVSTKYTSVSGTIYSNKTGKVINATPHQRKIFNKMQARVNTELSYSDELNEQNLLRFYTPKGFNPVNPKDYNYQNEFQKELGAETELGKKSTSLYDKLKKKSTENMYKTDAPEVNHTGGSSRINNKTSDD